MGMEPECSGRLSNPSEGPAFEPLISNGRGARFLRGEGSFSKYPLSRSLWQERERGETEKDMNLNNVAHLF
jgi:hypothetical protein